MLTPTGTAGYNSLRLPEKSGFKYQIPGSVDDIAMSGEDKKAGVFIKNQ